MCGILGIVTLAGRSPSIDDRRAELMRDRMAHRGPDGAGLWRHENIILAHRRLAVVDTSPAGHQPMLSRHDGKSGGRSAIVYNGEIYNDHELRDELTARGTTFRSRSDAETVLTMLDEFGERALPRLRGMYALAYINLDTQTLLLARDPLGIKPLYYTTVETGGTSGGVELVFASEIPSLLAHPAITPRPDFITISSYLTTIRTTLGPRTLFAGIRTLEPGEVATIDLRQGTLVVKTRRWWTPSLDDASAAPRDAREPSDPELKREIEDSIDRHLRADVPVCSLLSGGLDSTIIAAHAAREHSPLRTYSSGSPVEGANPDNPTDDLAAARFVAHKLGATHTEAPVSRELFARRWPEMVEALGLPLSTPNEVAINTIAGSLRRDGQVVALSGEGADELFGGYETPLTEALKHIASLADQPPTAWRERGGLFQLETAAWIAPSAKPSILTESALRHSESDHHLREHYTQRFTEIASESDVPDPLEAHLRFTREINLSGLLRRLDQSTMLESVEGRTPFADQRIASLAARTPMSRKFAPAIPAHNGEPAVAARTKISLRSAFGGSLPSLVLSRPKASFPLPFQGWLADHSAALRNSTFAREVFTDAAIAAASHSPEKFWPLAWPMLNIAMWGRRWWG